MPIRSLKNQYQGINVHFQGYAQNTYDGWSPFHATYIIRLTDSLTAVLPRGYRAVPERSLQLRIQERSSGHETTHYPRPDVTIRSHQHDSIIKTSQPTGSILAAPIAVLEVGENYRNPTAEPYEPTAVIIKKASDEVARIELLSPTNKRGEPRTQYLQKRAEALEAKIVLVEVDLLPQTETLVPDLPDYSQGDVGAYPFTISVIDPRPAPEHPSGKSEIYGFGVDEPIMPIRIPLLNEDKVTVNFGQVYDQTFNTMPAFSDEVDYSANPLGFERYTPADQAKIQARMLAISNAHQQGTDLDTLNQPLPVPANTEL